MYRQGNQLFRNGFQFNQFVDPDEIGKGILRAKTFLGDGYPDQRINLTS